MRVRQGEPMLPRRRRWDALLLGLYAALYLVLFLPSARYPGLVWLTLVPTALALWFGPLALVSGRGDRQWYDPATLFNFALFYYGIKGVSLATGQCPTYLDSMSYPKIVSGYHLVAFCTTAGILGWWIGYRWALGQVGRREDQTIQASDLSSCCPERMSSYRPHIGVLLLSLVGLASLAMFFHSTGIGVLTLIHNPFQRCYLTDGSMGVAAPLANLWKVGIGMFPLASLFWLATTEQGSKPSPFLWAHASAGLCLHLMVSGRAGLLAFVVSMVFLYHLRVRNISLGGFGVLCAAAITYAYVIRTWRHVVGTLGQAQGNDLWSALSVQGLYSFLNSTDLSDIRFFVLISDVYGQSLPLKYGTTLLRVFSQLVPRSLWPTKPVDLGVEIGELYGAGPLTGSPPGFFAEMYMNFGVLGVLIGSALLGVALALLYQRWMCRHSEPASTALYAIFLPSVLLLPSATFANVVITLTFSVAGTIFAFRVSAPWSSDTRADIAWRSD